MTTTKLNNEFEKVENIEQLMADLKNAVSEEDVQAVLNSYGLELKVEDLAAIQLDGEELNVEELDNVAGGCKCNGFLKRAITNVLCWLVSKATGKKKKCPDCGH